MLKRDLAPLAPALDHFLSEFREVASPAALQLIGTYLRGQLGPLPRKSPTAMACDAGIRPRRLHDLLSLNRWDERALIDTFQGYVRRMRGGFRHLVTLQETVCLKKGSLTPGVAFQPSSPHDRNRRSVILVHLGYSDGDLNCVLDSAVYLPKDWTDSPDRRRLARIPQEVSHRTRPQIALDLLDRAAANGLDVDCVALGTDYDSDPDFAAAMERRGYRTAGPSSVALLPASKLFRSQSSPTLTVEAARWAEENRLALERCRSEIGLEHFEVRSYGALLRHLSLSALSMFVHEVLVCRRGALKERSALSRDLPEPAFMAHPGLGA